MMWHHIYPRGGSENGVSVWGRQLDALLKGADLPEAEVWHFELSYTGTDELWQAEAFRRQHPGVKYVVTLHDPPVVCGKPFERWIRSRSWPAKVVRKALDLTVGRMVVRRVVRGAAKVIVLNGLAKPMVARAFGVEASRIVALPHLPSLEAPAGPMREVHKPVRVLAFGVLTPRKGTEDLIRAVGQPALSGRLQLEVFGGARADNMGYEVQLKTLVGELGLGDAVTFTGYGDDAALERALLACDVVALPYHAADVIHASGPLLTAMAFGRAVVASDLPIFADELGQGGLGLMVPSGDVAALAARLHELADDPKEIIRLGGAAYQHIQKRHSPEIIKQKLLEVYRSL
jgi:glycosyltransferase involved in cell wall biosynthesis